MNPSGDRRGETAKSLPLCKAVPSLTRSAARGAWQQASQIDGRPSPFVETTEFGLSDRLLTLVVAAGWGLVYHLYDRVKNVKGF